MDETRSVSSFIPAVIPAPSARGCMAAHRASSPTNLPPLPSAHGGGLPIGNWFRTFTLMKWLVRLLMVFSLCCNPHITVSVFAHKDRWDANKSDWTSLMRYAYDANSNKIDSSIKAGTNVNAQNARGWTALSVAVRQGNEAVVSQLLKNAADPNLSDTDGFTPLIWAGGLHSSVITKLLLQHGANPNKNLKNGYSALMFATSFGTIETMQILISKGADVNAKRGVDGMTALGLAEYNSDKAKVAFLKSHGGK